MASTPQKEARRVPGAVPYLISPDAPAHIEWLQRVFNAQVNSVAYADTQGSSVMHEVKPEGGHVMHADLTLNGAAFYISDRIETSGYPPVQDILEGKARGVMFHVDLENADSVWEKAVEAKAKVRVVLEPRFWGAKFGVFVDPFGFEWAVSTKLEAGEEGK